MDRSPNVTETRSSDRSSDQHLSDFEEERDTLADDALEEEEDLDPEIDALLGLAQMDLESATAYETVAEAVTETRVAEMLRTFAKDHRRHVSDIQRLVTDVTGEAEFASPDPQISTFVTIVAAASEFGTDAGLRALIASEQFTNATYEAAVDLVTKPESRIVMERNLLDEQRHLQALTQELERTVRREADSDKG